MAEYAMALKNGKDIIHKTNQQTLEEAKKYLEKFHFFQLYFFSFLY